LGESFGQVVSGEGLTCYACAVLRNHAHLLVRKHKLKAEDMIHLLKTASASVLVQRGFVPQGHPVWSTNDYVAYKDSPPAIWAAVDYIADNLRKHRMESQTWPFVTPYDGWPRSWRK